MSGEGTHKIQQLTDSLVDTMDRLSYGTLFTLVPLRKWWTSCVSKMMTNSFT